MLDQTQTLAAVRQAVTDMTGTDVSDSDPLISSGLIDSLSVVKLIARLEERLGIRVIVSEVQPDDFETVEMIVETLERASQPK
jgi:acyl carrier protein